MYNLHNGYSCLLQRKIRPKIRCVSTRTIYVGEHETMRKCKRANRVRRDEKLTIYLASKRPLILRSSHPAPFCSRGY